MAVSLQYFFSRHNILSTMSNYDLNFDYMYAFLYLEKSD